MAASHRMGSRRSTHTGFLSFTVPRGGSHPGAPAAPTTRATSCRNLSLSERSGVAALTTVQPSLVMRRSRTSCASTTCSLVTDGSRSSSYFPCPSYSQITPSLGKPPSALPTNRPASSNTSNCNSCPLSRSATASLAHVSVGDSARPSAALSALRAWDEPGQRYSASNAFTSAAGSTIPRWSAASIAATAARSGCVRATSMRVLATLVTRMLSISVSHSSVGHPA